MNVSLQKLFLGLLLLLAIPLGVEAQMGRTKDLALETYRDIPVDYQFVSTPYNPNFWTRPTHGKAQTTNLGQNNYRVTYTPNPGYVGSDFFAMTVWEGGSLALWRFSVTVLPSKVDARADLFYTYVNQPVDLDVLFNDISSSGNLTLKSVLLVNNGEAQVLAGQNMLRFTPTADFEGIAQLNYVTCDEFGTCDQGTVSINVLGAGETDTLRVFTKKNKPQAILVPSEFLLAVPPANGVYDPAGNLPTYTPQPGFVGHDFMELTSDGMTKAVEITVLDLTDNLFAFDDEAATTPAESVEFNILDNDVYGPASGCLTVSQPAHGNVQQYNYPNGTVVYTPAEGFRGVDKFTYSVKPPDCVGSAETATVYVYVSEFEPAYSKFRMVTPKRTPLVIGYDVPIKNFSFAITDQADQGEVIFLHGKADTTIYGQRIKGYNLILYIPEDGVDSGTDEFEIEYCVVKNRDCQARKTVKIEVDILDIGDGAAPMCFNDCIWAGDTNLDGIVNMEDILPLGVFMGKVGVPRDDANFSLWYGQYGDDWGEAGPEIKGDLKHVDTNGDSLVTALDTLAINQFYGNTHSLAPARVPDYKHTVHLNGNVFANPGDLVELDMVLGEDGAPAVDVYGFTFPFEYNPDFFVPESVQIDYTSSSWLAYGSPILSMMRNDKQGLLESGVTRTNGNPISGIGKIGKVRLIIVDDIAGFRPDDDEVTTTLGGGIATVGNGTGQTFGARIEEVTIHINLTGEKKAELENPEIAESLLKVFPNPTADFLNIHLNGGHSFQRVLIHNLAGQQVFDSGALDNRSKRINLNQLSNGIYFMSVQTERGVIRKKFEVIR